MHKWARYCLLPFVLARDVMICLVASVLSILLRMSPEFVHSAVRGKALNSDIRSIHIVLHILTKGSSALEVMKVLVIR